MYENGFFIVFWFSLLGLILANIILLFLTFSPLNLITLSNCGSRGGWFPKHKPKKIVK